MKQNAKWLTALVAIAGALVTVNSAMAQVEIDNFQNFTPNALYASWATPAATITQHPASWEVNSLGYGSLWKYEGDIDGSHMTQVQLTVDISGDPGFIAGPIVDLIDAAGNWGTYAFYGITTPGSYVLTADLSTTPWLNTADIQHIHLECDPSSFTTGYYDLNFKNLALVPEPASLTLLGLGALSLMIARRHAR